MEPRFTRGEYWLLETAVTCEWDIPILIESDLELHVNKKGHGLTRNALIETLHRLLSSGLIYAENRVDFSDEATAVISTKEQIEPSQVYDWIQENATVISTKEQIELVLDERKSWSGVPVEERKVTFYGLTQEGGAQWEAFAAPDWQKYIDVSCHFSDGYEYGMWELICADKARLERYFESMCFYDPHEVVLESVERDYIAPWQATYWKQLEGAHRIRFREPDEREQENLLQLSPPSFPDMGYFDKLWYAWR